MKMKSIAPTVAEHVTINGVLVPLVDGVCEVDSAGAEILKSHGFEPVEDKPTRKAKSDAKESKDGKADDEKKSDAKDDKKDGK